MAFKLWQTLFGVGECDKVKKDGIIYKPTRWVTTIVKLYQ